MPTNVRSQESNKVGLRIAEEETITVLPGTPDWYAYLANSYGNFGAENVLTARDPINENRSRLKGSITDQNADGSTVFDFNPEIYRLLQGLVFATTDFKGVEVVTAVDVDAGNADEYEVAETEDFLVNSLIYASGFSNSVNNGLKVVTAIVADTSIEVATGSLVDETPPADAQLEVVGYQFPAGDLDVVVTGDYARYTSASITMTTLGINPGEFIFVGGDAGSNADSFQTAANNGFKRVHEVNATSIIVDKSDANMSAEDNSATSNATVRIFIGRVLKNKSGADIIKRTYQLERTLGAPDTNEPAEIQAEYVAGAVANTGTIDIPTAGKSTLDIGWLACTQEVVTGEEGVKSGNRPALVKHEMFNTSRDVARIRLSQVSADDESTELTFAFVTGVSFSINNNCQALKAVGVLGAFDIIAGTFEVSAELEAFFTDVSATNAVIQNFDMSLDCIMVKDNAGVAIDMPLVALGGGRITVEKDQAVRLPLTADAAQADSAVGTGFEHTLLFTLFPYLPDRAEP